MGREQNEETRMKPTSEQYDAWATHCDAMFELGFMAIDDMCCFPLEKFFKKMFSKKYRDRQKRAIELEKIRDEMFRKAIGERTTTHVR